VEIINHNFTEDGRVNLKVYIPDKSRELHDFPRPMVLIFPGGGYGFCSDREAEPIALSYNAAGFNAAVLRYSIAEHSGYPAPLADASKAVKFIRDNAERFHTDKDKIAVCGFSAGGHLAAWLGTKWNDKEIQKAAGVENDENKPNALILGYPVISGREPTHNGSINNLLKSVPDEEKESVRNLICCEENVGEHTPPAFIFHTADDAAVPVIGALNFARALSRNKIPFEIHVYRSGSHGLSLANYVTAKSKNSINADVEGWFDLSVKWILRTFNFPPEF